MYVVLAYVQILGLPGVYVVLAYVQILGLPGVYDVLAYVQILPRVAMLLACIT